MQEADRYSFLSQALMVSVSQSTIQCVSLDSPSFVIYPDIKATEVKALKLKCYLCSFYFRIDNVKLKLVETKEPHCIVVGK